MRSYMKSKWLGYAALLLIAGAFVVMLYWLYSVPPDAIKVTPTPIKIENKDVALNGFAILDYTLCKNVSTIGRVGISLVSNNTQLMLPSGTDVTPKGCHEPVRVALPIPPQAVKGKYHFHLRATYSVNPLVTRVQEFDTEEFNIQ